MHDKGSGAPRVVLITKTATQNQGNQALSIAWRDFLARRYPEANVRLVERAPSYLKRYTLGALARARDPIAAFDALARKLVARMPAAPERDPSRWEVRHDHGQQQAGAHAHHPAIDDHPHLVFAHDPSSAAMPAPARC